jgi:type II secretory pathway component GspD/PulD (secretin)
MMLRSAVTLLLMLVGHPVGGSAVAQEPAKGAGGGNKPAVTALMVEVTISRHLGDKRLSSTPYELSVLPDVRASLRMGGDVPVPTTTFTPMQKDDVKPAPPLTSHSYRSVGTYIDVVAASAVDGQHKLTITIEESSIYPAELAPPTTKTTGAPAFRTFKSNNNVALRDGQIQEFVMATDRISGEVLRVAVKLTVVK